MHGLDQRFMIQNNRKRREIQEKIRHQEEDDEETLRYATVEKPRFLNEPQGTFGSVFDETKSINKAPNVFDATAIFHTTEKENHRN